MRNRILIAFWGGAVLGVATALSFFTDKPVSKRELRRIVKQETSKRKIKNPN